jgi:hypothetical protein
VFRPSLVLKFGAVLFIVYVLPAQVINFQLLGGVWILQTLPAVFLGLYSSKKYSVLLTACFFWVQLRLLTKQPTRRQVTLRATYHMTRETRVRWMKQQPRMLLVSYVSPDGVSQALLLFPYLMTLHEHGFDGCSVFAGT